MRPAMRRLTDTILPRLAGCPITRANIRAAEHILGPNLGSLKGKTTRRANRRADTHIDPVPPSVLKLLKHVTLEIDIIYISERLTKIIRLYKHRGFNVTTILADPEFEPLRNSFPFLNTAAADEHVPGIERHIRYLKDTARSTYCMLPFLPSTSYPTCTSAAQHCLLDQCFSLRSQHFSGLLPTLPHPRQQHHIQASCSSRNRVLRSNPRRSRQHHERPHHWRHLHGSYR